MVLPLAAILAARCDEAASADGPPARPDSRRRGRGPDPRLASVGRASARRRLETSRAAPSRMPDQLARLRLVLGLTSPRDTVFDGFTGAGAFRPHAYYWFFLHDEIRALLGDAERDGLKRALRDGDIAPAVVLFDSDVQDLSPE
jgi:hypothetical protein